MSEFDKEKGKKGRARVSGSLVPQHFELSLIFYWVVIYTPAATGSGKNLTIMDRLELYTSRQTYEHLH